MTADALAEMRALIGHEQYHEVGEFPVERGAINREHFPVFIERNCIIGTEFHEAATSNSRVHALRQSVAELAESFAVGA